MARKKNWVQEWVRRGVSNTAAGRTQGGDIGSNIAGMGHNVSYRMKPKQGGGNFYRDHYLMARGQDVLSTLKGRKKRHLPYRP